MNRHQQRAEVDRQVRALFHRSRSFGALPPEEQKRVLANTAEIVETMAQNKLAQAQAASDPFAVPFGPGNLAGQNLAGAGVVGTGSGASNQQFTGGATTRKDGETFKPTKEGDFGTALATGVGQAGELLREVNFPNFVRELVQGVFQACIDASIKQMEAYAQLVQSVTMSLNDFRDANVTENQARDHLVGKFPQLMQINITEAGPRVGLRPGADDLPLPNIAQSLGLSEELSSLDEESIEEVLVPAARNDLARSRQSLLATMVLMGINRIIVTDGKINAKLKFNFKARDQMTLNAQTFDYTENLGDSRSTVYEHESTDTTGESFKGSRSDSDGWLGRSQQQSESGESDRWSKGKYTNTQAPTILLQSFEDKNTQSELEANATLSGDVTLNFKSETFDLNKLASADEIFKLERVRSAGRGAPGAPVGSPQAGGAPAATPAPAAAPPAASTPPATKA